MNNKVEIIKTEEYKKISIKDFGIFTKHNSSKAVFCVDYHNVTHQFTLGEINLIQSYLLDFDNVFMAYESGDEIVFINKRVDLWE
jgi:hypothetical protein